MTTVETRPGPQRPPVAPPASPPAPPPAEPSGLPRSSRTALFCLVAICLSAGAGAGLAASSMQAKQYAARAEIVYPVAQELPTGFLRLDRSLSTQLVLIRSNAVLYPVAARSGTTSDRLRERVGASVLDDSEVIRIQVRGSSPEDATTLTAAVVQSYRAVAAARDPERRTQLDTSLAEVATALTAARDRRSALLAAPRSTTSLDLVITDLDGEIGNLRSRQISLQTERDALGRNAPYVVTQPYPLLGQVSPRPALSTGAGALAGLLIAAVAGSAQVRRRTRDAA